MRSQECDEANPDHRHVRTGKSTLVRELQERGYRAIDTDYDGWSHWVDLETGLPAPEPGPGEYAWDRLDRAWDEERMRSLLSEDDGGVLFVSGTSPNQGQFYSRFDHIVLLTASNELIAERLGSRDSNPYGKSPEELEKVMEDKRTVEPLLRKRATVEIDTSAPVERVVAAVLGLLDAGGGSPTELARTGYAPRLVMAEPVWMWADVRPTLVTAPVFHVLAGLP